MPRKVSSPPSTILAQRNESKLNHRNVSSSPSVNIKSGVEQVSLSPQQQLPTTTIIYSPSNVTPSSNDVVGKRTLFLNPLHRRDDDDSDTYSIPDDFTNIILNGFGSNQTVQQHLTTTAADQIITPETAAGEERSSNSTSNKREPSRRSSRKQVNYNEQYSDDEDEKKPKKGSKRKKVAKQENSDSESMYVDDDEGGVPTCVRVSALPRILETLMANIPPNVTLDSYGIQTALLNCAMDVENFTSEEVLTKFCQQLINKRSEFRIRGLRSWQSDNADDTEIKTENETKQEEEEETWEETKEEED